MSPSGMRKSVKGIETTRSPYPRLHTDRQNNPSSNHGKFGLRRTTNYQISPYLSAKTPTCWPKREEAIVPYVNYKYTAKCRPASNKRRVKIPYRRYVSINPNMSKCIASATETLQVAEPRCWYLSNTSAAETLLVAESHCWWGQKWWWNKPMNIARWPSYTIITYRQNTDRTRSIVMLHLNGYRYWSW
jgi:hypothetical protein